MARYTLLDAFDELRKARGHTDIFRYLHEIVALMKSGESDPTRSKFRSHIAFNKCRAFISDGHELGGAEDFEIFDELREIEGMHQGEALLIEYALRNLDSIIISGDKRMINGLRRPDASKFRVLLKGRIVHLERVLWTLAANGYWDAVRGAVCNDPDCDRALYDVLKSGLEKPESESRFYSMMVAFERSSAGVLRSVL